MTWGSEDQGNHNFWATVALRPLYVGPDPNFTLCTRVAPVLACAAWPFRRGACGDTVCGTKDGAGSRPAGHLVADWLPPRTDPRGHGGDGERHAGTPGRALAQHLRAAVVIHPNA